MPDLIAITAAAIKAFNDAKTKQNYNDLAQYLSQQVTIHRVDDSTLLQGNPKYIVDQLNTYQDGKWPQLTCDDWIISPRSKDVVLGTGVYQDTASGPEIPVRCSYHFDAKGCIDVAYVIPFSTHS